MANTRVRTLGETIVVSCPGCDRTRGTSPGLQFCSRCGTAFVVERDRDE